MDELSRRFTVDAVPLRANAYLELRQHVSGAPAWGALGDATLALIDEAVAADQPDLALRLAETTLVAARKSGNLELIRKTTLRIIKLQEKGAGDKGQGTGS